MRRLALRISQPNVSSDDLLFQDPTSPERLFRSVVQPPLIGHRPISVASLAPTPPDGGGANNVASSFPAPPPPFKAVLRSKSYKVAGLVLTGFSLMLNDVRELALEAEADYLVDSVLITLTMLFTADIMLKYLARRRYRGSFAFWMDCIATIGLLADIHMVTGDFLLECESHYYQQLSLIPRAARLRGSAVQLLFFLASSSAHSPVSSSFQCSLPKKLRKRSSVRPNSTVMEEDVMSSQTITRKVAHSDLCNMNELSPGPVKSSGTFSIIYKLGREQNPPKLADPLPTSERKESRISKEVTNRLVSLLVLVVMALGLFSWATVGWLGETRSQMYGLRLLKEAEDVPRYEEFVREFVTLHSAPDSLATLVRLTVRAEILWDQGFQSSRATDICSVSLPPYTAQFSIHLKNRVFAVFDLCTTLLLCVLLLLTCLELSLVLRYLVLFPLEHMLTTVRQMAMRPLSLTNASKSATIAPKRKLGCCGITANYAETEIKTLEHAFRKIGVMLAIVYGSAGSEIITSTLTLEGGFSLETPGRKVLAVFCFAKIGSFDVLMEVLGKNVLQYVNQVSSSIHSVSEKFLGSVNRNLGDSYLLVWKFPNRELITVKNRMVLNPFSTEVKTTSSLALLCAVKALAKVVSSKGLFLYRKHKQVVESGATIENRVTFGFHVGWAFEGAIGSPFKIDASYLSPHVNLASRVESATKQYGVSILMSSDMYMRLEEEVRHFTRLIDTVKLKGVAEPVGLHCFDVDPTGLTLKDSRLNTREIIRKRARLKAALENGRITVSQMFTLSAAIAALRVKYSKPFFASYAQAYNFYVSGKWLQASKVLKSECLAELPHDGPSLAILAYMEEFGFEAPLTWRGYRELHSK